MRPGLFISAVIALAAIISPAWAEDPRLAALGRADLVLELDTTVLSLYNLGNPAGAALLPRQNRMDWMIDVAQIGRKAEFVTGLPGSPSTFDPLGNTLLPNTLYTRQTSTLKFKFNDYGNFGGILQWLDQDLVLQIKPEAAYSDQWPTDSGPARLTVLGRVPGASGLGSSTRFSPWAPE